MYPIAPDMVTVIEKRSFTLSHMVTVIERRSFTLSHVVTVIEQRSFTLSHMVNYVLTKPSCFDTGFPLGSVPAILLLCARCRWWFLVS
jgi:hypothetical protein